jgi:hypothetical protein
VSAGGGGAAAARASPGKSGDGETSHVDDSVFKLHGDASGLQQKIAVVTGEEGTEVLFEARSKLRIFIESETYGDEVRSNIWKERAKGQVKLLRQANGSCSLLMRQESTEKVVANFTVNFDCRPAVGNPKARTVMGMDSERAKGAAPELAKFAVSFKTAELADQFDAVYTECKAINAARPPGASAAAACAAPAAPAAVVVKEKAASPAASTSAFGPSFAAPAAPVPVEAMVVKVVAKMIATKLDLSPVRTISSFADVRAALQRKQGLRPAARGEVPTPLMFCRVVLANLSNGEYTRAEFAEFLAPNEPEQWAVEVGLSAADVPETFWNGSYPLARIALHVLTGERGDSV